MKRRVWFLIVVPALVGWATLPAAAQQQLEIVAPPTERAPAVELVIPGQPPELTRPREQDFYPDQIRSRHDPAFIVPFTTVVRTGPTSGVRVGLSGWTAPAGRGEWLLRREAAGVLSFGLSVAWDVAIEPEKPAQPAPAR